jgi:hypothetical protein
VLIATDNQIPTLVGSFVVAAVLVSPFAYRQVRKVRRERERLAPPPPEPATAAEPVEDTDLATAMARIATDAAAHEPGVEFTVPIPVVATLGGRSADRAIVESIVADGLRRDGVEILERTGDRWRCRRPEITD